MEVQQVLPALQLLKVGELWPGVVGAPEEVILVPTDSQVMCQGPELSTARVKEGVWVTPRAMAVLHSDPLVANCDPPGK